ncbi:MAG: Hsp20/alpha crystallin family protein [Spirochaetales bacterium]|nr:Hsp20/alpha crystallin family protein [Spirochaetales bacterium]
MRYVISRKPVNNFDSMFGDLFSDWSSLGRAVPAIDLYEKEDAYVLEAEVASYDKDRVKIDVHKHILTLSYDGNKKEEKEEDKKSFLVQEIARPAFERRFSLPEGINEEAICADFKDGLVIITMPKAKVEEPKRIEIKFN